MRKNAKTILVLLLVLCIAIFYVSATKLAIHPPGFLAGVQGLEPQFDSVYFDDKWWSSSETSGSPSSMSFGYSMDFDPDAATDGYPDLCASQQPITVQTDVEPKKYVWDYKVGSKTLANGTIVDEYKQFELYRYRCDWAMNLWLSGPEWEAAVHYALVGTTKDYAGTKVWLKLVPRCFVYFTENPDQVFFAPAYIGLAQDVTWAGINKDGSTVLNDPQIASTQDLIPKVGGETVGIYYQRGGGDVLTEETLLKYQGTTLDPEIFRNEYWMRIDLMSFHSLSWYDYGLWHNWKFPSAYMKFTVYLFVVGQWTVYIKTGEVPTLNPHTPIMVTGSPLGDFLAGILNWLANPFNQLWLVFIIIVVVVVIVSIASPGVWTALASRKRGNGG
jgi:hypothetical protein